jgi:hypothetical protein
MWLEKLHKKSSRYGSSQIKHPEHPIAMRVDYLFSETAHDQGIKNYIISQLIRKEKNP